MTRHSNSLIDKTINFKYTALMIAARQGKFKIVQYLIDNGADITLKDKYGNTAFTIAAQRGHDKVVQCLIENGANLESLDNHGQTALMHAAHNGHRKIVNLLVEAAKKLQNANEHINQKNTYANATAFMMTVEHGHTKVAKCLIKNGANITDIAKSSGLTTLMHAANEGYSEIVTLLLEEAKTLPEKDRLAFINQVHLKPEATALMMAVYEGHTDIVKLLIKNGADVNIATEKGVYSSYVCRIQFKF